jgi:hypothetical protein
MQDGATPHTAKETVRGLGHVFGKLDADDTIIINGL